MLVSETRHVPFIATSKLVKIIEKVCAADKSSKAQGVTHLLIHASIAPERFACKPEGTSTRFVIISKC